MAYRVRAARALLHVLRIDIAFTRFYAYIYGDKLFLDRSSLSIPPPVEPEGLTRRSLEVDLSLSTCNGKSTQTFLIGLRRVGVNATAENERYDSAEWQSFLNVDVQTSR